MLLRKIPLFLAAMLLVATVTVGIARGQGGSVTDFTVQKNGGGGSTALSSYSGQKAVVVIFMNPACAFTRLYQERLSALNSAYSGRGVQFMFVNVPINLDAADSGGNTLATFSDEGAASTTLGVSKTTEAVVLQPTGSGFAVRYRGAIDDNPQVASGVQQHYLQQVLDNVLAGRPAGVADKRAAGCLIKR